MRGNIMKKMAHRLTQINADFDFVNFLLEDNKGNINGGGVV